ncbi:MAG TPA: hypothetical protein VIX89_15230, partial [Bryobacteraceae bacterium]
ELESLPDDPDRFAEQLQIIAASAGGAPGNAVVTVDGFLHGGRLPPKSAIREVRINPDLYSAEYDRPPYQGGRIEITTKPGAELFHGSAFFIFNDSALNARDSFARERAPHSERKYGVELAGPILRRRLGFALNLEKRDIDAFSNINAVILDSALQPAAYNVNVSAPQRLWNGLARADWQISERNVFSASFSRNRDKLDNQGIGGFVLQSGGFTSLHREDNLRLNATTLLNPRTINEMRLGFSFDNLLFTPVSNAPTVTVFGAFQSGGSPVQSLNRQRNAIELADNLSLTRKGHSIKVGVALFERPTDEVSRQGFQGLSLFGGTSLDGGAAISGLDQYRRSLASLPGGQPSAYTITTGIPSISNTQWRVSTFVQDQWNLTPRIWLAYGLRYDAQTSPTALNGVAPRLGLAYSIDKNRRWILRMHAGIFTTPIDQSLMLEASRLNGQRQIQTTVYYPTAGSIQVSTIRTLEGRLRFAQSSQTEIGLEHQFPHGWFLRANATWTDAWGLLRSRNINSPVVETGTLNPLLAARPYGAGLNIFQYESSGKLHGPVLFVNINQNVSKRYTLVFGYLYFDLRTNADNSSQFPQSSYSEQGELARPSWQSTHRAFVINTWKFPWKVQGSVTLNAASGLPYNITTGRDNNGDGIFNDRPAIAGAPTPASIETSAGTFVANAIGGNAPRNALTNPATVSLNANLSRRFVLHLNQNSPDRSPSLTLNIRATNALNHTNVLGSDGVLLSPFFGRPNSASAPRLLEAGLRVSF